MFCGESPRRRGPLYRSSWQRSWYCASMRRLKCKFLERSQPVLPMRPGRSDEPMTIGMAPALFAALNVATGRVISYQAQTPQQRVLKLPACRIDASSQPTGIRISWITMPPIKRRPWRIGWQTPPLETSFYPTHSSWPESGGTILCQNHQRAHPARRLSKPSPTWIGRSSNNKAALQIKLASPPLDGLSRSHPRKVMSIMQ